MPACLVQQDGSPPRTGAALRQSLAAFIAIAATIKTRITKVIRVGDDLAVLYTDWTITVTGIVPLSGKAILVMRLQQGGTWKLIIDDPFGRN